MKKCFGPFIVFLLIALWSVSGFLTSLRLEQLVMDGTLAYGPLPDQEVKSYHYQAMKTAFDPSVPLKRSAELTKQEFEELILTSMDVRSRENFRPYLNSVLNFSVDYQIDPFWIISIMMVESNFNTKAVSPKNALGLMQIKPDTAMFLYQLMKRDIPADKVAESMHHPESNIELGVYYLKKLLYNFRLNYKHATVAYNMGPQNLRNRLVENTLDVSNYSYLVKVKDRYSVISQQFTQAIKNRPRPYELTYVVPNQGLKLEDKLITLLSKDSSENLMASFP